jgi:hypothetical protein
LRTASGPTYKTPVWKSDSDVDVPAEKATNSDRDSAADLAEPQVLSPNAAIALLLSWYDEDPEEQRDTWEKLKGVNGEERLSERELFP